MSIKRRDIPNTFTAEELRRRYNLDKEAETASFDEIIGENIVSIANGGTGAGTSEQALNNILSESVIPIANGGTGVTALEDLKSLLQVKEKSIITAALSADQQFTYSTANSNVRVKLDNILSGVGNNIAFDNTANRFVIGSGVSKVKISAVMTFSGIANSCRLIIQKYDGTNYKSAAMAYFRNPTAAYTNTIVLPPMLINTEGIESFHMVFLSAATGTVKIAGGELLKTYMTVEEV